MNDQLTMDNSPLTANAVPALRFPEFSGAWIPNLLGDLFPKIRNGFVGTATPFYQEEGVAYLQGKNIKGGTIDPKGLVKISEDFHIKQRKSQLKKNDILMVQSGHVGECAVVTDEFVNANCHALVVMTPDNTVKAHFIKSLFHAETGERLIQKIKTGNTIAHILTSDLKRLIVSVPNFKEQQKIAAFLTSVDTKIEQLGKKKALLEKYKKGMMQKLFSQALRFKDELGNDKVNGKAREGSLGCFPDWEEKQLAEIFDISAGGDVKKLNFSKKKTDQFNIPVYANALQKHGLYGYTDFPKVIKEAVTVTGRGDVGYAEARLLPFVAVVRLLVLLPKDKASIVFFKHAINYMKIFVESTGVPQLTAPQISQYNLFVPVFREQQKIASFLSTLDKKIDLITTELNQAKTFKKGLLQQLFV